MKSYKYFSYSLCLQYYWGSVTLVLLYGSGSMWFFIICDSKVKNGPFYEIMQFGSTSTNFTKWKVCHISTIVVVTVGCESPLSEMSHNHMGHCTKLCKCFFFFIVCIWKVCHISTMVVATLVYPVLVGPATQWARTYWPQLLNLAQGFFSYRSSMCYNLEGVPD